MAEFIPVSLPSLGGNEKLYVDACLESTWISSIGEFIDRFETRFAEYCRTKHAISCCNGTVALHLALLGLGVGPGDDVLVPSLTYVATVNAVKYCGATPVFVDSDRETWNISPDDIRRKISPRTKAIIPVHLYGKPAPMEEIIGLAADHGIKVVEDAAEAVGATYRGRPVGSIGDLATFSFFGNKIITCGEGGMVLTNDDQLASRIRQLKGQGQDPARRYWFPIVGYNYRMTNIEAAIGLAQLERVEDYLTARDEIAGWYRSALEGMANLMLPASHKDERAVCWLFSVVFDEETGNLRDRVAARLKEEGVDSRPFFYPCHTLPPYAETGSLSGCENAEWLGRRGLSLPTWVGLKRDQIIRICDSIKSELMSNKL
jgi:perosamine synthetase